MFINQNALKFIIIITRYSVFISIPHYELNINRTQMAFN